MSSILQKLSNLVHSGKGNKESRGERHQKRENLMFPLFVATKDTHRDTETHRETLKHTDTPTDTHTHTETHVFVEQAGNRTPFTTSCQTR